MRDAGPAVDVAAFGGFGGYRSGKTDWAGGRFGDGDDCLNNVIPVDDNVRIKDVDGIVALFVHDKTKAVDQRNWNQPALQVHIMRQYNILGINKSLFVIRFIVYVAFTTSDCASAGRTLTRGHLEVE